MASRKKFTTITKTRSQGAHKEEEVQESSLEQLAAIKKEVGEEVLRQIFEVPQIDRNDYKYQFDACIPEDLRAAFEALPKAPKVFQMKQLLSSKAHPAYEGMYPAFFYASWFKASMAKQNDKYLKEFDQCFDKNEPQQLHKLGDFLNFVEAGDYTRKVWLIIGRMNYTYRKTMNKVLVVWAPYMVTVDEIEAQFGKGALNRLDTAQLDREWRFSIADLLEPTAKVKDELVDVSVATQEEISTEQESTVPERVPWQLAHYHRYMESKRLERINRISSDLPSSRKSRIKKTAKKKKKARTEGASKQKQPVDDSLGENKVISTEPEPTVPQAVPPQLAHRMHNRISSDLPDPCETESSYLYHDLITGVGSRETDEVPQKGCVNLCGASVTMFNRVKQVAMSQQQQTQPNSIGNYAILILFPLSGAITPSLTISGLDQELQEWLSQLEKSCSIGTKSSSTTSNNIEANFNIAQELSNLIIYCRAVPFLPEKVGFNFTEMSSFPETKVDKWLHLNHCSILLNYNSHQFSRVYPKGARLDSSNYDPTKMWNVGIQMAALNYQTGDRAMQLNQAKFSLQNGACGYVLKPECMFEESFNPDTTDSIITQGSLDPWMLSVRVICARHLTKSKGRSGLISPFVEVEIVGAEFDNTKFKTATIDDNGLNPYWNESFNFKVHCPDLAFLRFAVYDEDVFGEPQFVGQATYPLTTIRQGFRNVRLQNEYSQVLEMTAILVQVTIQSSTTND